MTLPVSDLVSIQEFFEVGANSKQNGVYLVRAMLRSDQSKNEFPFAFPLLDRS